MLTQLKLQTNMGEDMEEAKVLISRPHIVQQPTEEEKAEKAEKEAKLIYPAKSIKVDMSQSLAINKIQKILMLSWIRLVLVLTKEMDAIIVSKML